MEENKQKNKTIQDTELNNVAGGNQYFHPIYCSCGHAYRMGEASDKKTVKDGCSTRAKFQCPNCGIWNDASF